jgi:hypothetical protein
MNFDGCSNDLPSNLVRSHAASVNCEQPYVNAHLHSLCSSQCKPPESRILSSVLGANETTVHLVEPGGRSAGKPQLKRANRLTAEPRRAQRRRSKRNLCALRVSAVSLGFRIRSNSAAPSLSGLSIRRIWLLPLCAEFLPGNSVR